MKALKLFDSLALFMNCCFLHLLYAFQIFNAHTHLIICIFDRVVQFWQDLDWLIDAWQLGWTVKDLEAFSL